MTLLDPARPELPALAQRGLERHAVRVAEVALLLLPALVLAMPSGLLPFGLCLLASTVMGWPLLRRASVQMGGTRRALWWLTAAVFAMSLLSIWLFEHGLKDVDNRSRFIVLPWAAIWAYALQPRLVWLWRGALIGIFITLALAIFQVAREASNSRFSHSIWSRARNTVLGPGVVSRLSPFGPR